MKIALFSSAIEPKDGYGNIAYELTQELMSMGIDLTLFLPKSLDGIGPQLGLQCETRYVLPGYVYRMYQRQAPFYLKTVNVEEFDLVHSLFSFPYCFVAGRSAKRYNKPFIMGAQGTHGVRPLTYKPERWMLKWSYKQADTIIVPSAYTRDQILQHSGEQYNIDIIHNGVHFDRFQKNVDADVERIRAQYPGKKILLTVGGLWGRKGHDLVISALAGIREKRNDVVYVIVGEGNAQADLEVLAAGFGVRDMVEFVGRKSGDELVAYFKACDIYVHTPKVIDLKFEGFGIVYLEASACAKPIVATDAGGVRDAVLDGKTGLIAGNEDIAGISERITRLLDDPMLAERLGEEGKNYASEHSWNLIAKKYIETYESLLEKAPQSD